MGMALNMRQLVDTLCIYKCVSPVTVCACSCSIPSRISVRAGARHHRVLQRRRWTPPFRCRPSCHAGYHHLTAERSPRRNHQQPEEE